MEFIFNKTLLFTKLQKNRKSLGKLLTSFEKQLHYNQQVKVLNKRDELLNNFSSANIIPIINQRNGVYSMQTQRKMLGSPHSYKSCLWYSFEHGQSEGPLLRTYHHSVLVKSFSTSAARSSLSDTDIALSTSTAVLPDSVSALLGNTPVNQLLFPDFPTIFGAEKILQYLHEFTGLPWWSVIVLTALLMRVVLMLPMTIHVNHNQDKLRSLVPEMKEKSQILHSQVEKSMRQFGWDKKRAMKEYDEHMKQLLREMYIRENCHPMKNTAIFWLQTPIFLSMSYSLRNLVTRAKNPDMESHADFVGVSNEGLAWITDLSSVDATWILPVAVGLVTLVNIEMAHLSIPTVTTYRKLLTIALRSSCLLCIVVSATVPTAMTLYWVSSGTFATLQNVLFEFSPFRRAFKLPKTPTESNHPLRSLTQRAKVKYFNKQ